MRTRGFRKPEWQRIQERAQLADISAKSSPAAIAAAEREAQRASAEVFVRILRENPVVVIAPADPNYSGELYSPLMSDDITRAIAKAAASNVAKAGVHPQISERGTWNRTVWYFGQVEAQVTLSNTGQREIEVPVKLFVYPSSERAVSQLVVAGYDDGKISNAILSAFTPGLK